MNSYIKLRMATVRENASYALTEITPIYVLRVILQNDAKTTTRASSKGYV